MKEAPRLHLMNCAEPTSRPDTMLESVGFGRVPAQMCAINSGPVARAERSEKRSSLLVDMPSSRRMWPNSWEISASRFSFVN